MLDVIRQNAQSWMVKVLFALIVIVFVFWGVGSFRSDPSKVVATVNGSNIPAREFMRAYERTLEAMRDENPELSTADIQRFSVKQRVLDQMINSMLLKQVAAEWNITVSPAELTAAIREIPAFHNEDRGFDPNVYVSVLQANQLSPGQFETDFQQNMLMEKISEYVELPAAISEEQARDFFGFAREEVRMEYALFSLDEYTDRITPTQEQIKTYYDQNPDQFAVPERIRISYLTFSPSSLARPEAVSPAEVESYYEQNKELFRREEEVKARHILIQLDRDASEKEAETALDKITKLKLQIEGGADFAEVAREHSEGPSNVQGGDLGWFGRGQMVSEFEEVAFSLQTDKVSDPVRTDFGYHLILVEERRTEGIQSLEEAEERIRTRIAEDKASDRVADLLDQVLESVVSGQSLETAAQAADLEVSRTGYFNRNDGPRELQLPSETLQNLFELPENTALEAPVLLDEGYLLAQKLDTKPRTIRPLEEVTARIRTILKQDGARALAREEAAKALAALKSGETPQEITDQLTISEPFGRTGVVPGLGLNPELISELFAAPEGTWLNNTYEVDAGYVTARLSERIAPSEEEWEQQKSFWIANLRQVRAQELFSSFMENLRNKADIVLVNPDILS
ncbi:MAG: SurA N-terminal domain-containing protein [Desulfovibrionales bacterium]